MRLWMTIALAIALPNLSLAAEPPISRSDGLTLIWAPLRRAARPANEPQFHDVDESHPNFLLITYAKSRGIVDDGLHFHPDKPLELKDALLWLIRSRNIASPETITEKTVETYARRNGLLEYGVIAENQILTRSSLNKLINNIDTVLKNKKHMVSYYADSFAGRGTAFGETFDPRALTAAHRTLPYNTLVRVTNLDNGKSIIVRINDRGPYVAGRDMDLSLAAFNAIGDRGSGLLRNVAFERLGDASVVRECENVRYRRRLGRALLSPGIPYIAQVGTTLHLSANSGFRMILERAPFARPLRPREWINRGEKLDIAFNREGVYTIVLHEDSGTRRRFRIRAVSQCAGRD